MSKKAIILIAFFVVYYIYTKKLQSIALLN